MKLSIELTVGMVCTFAAIIAIIFILICLYKKREATANHPIVIGLSLIALVISISTAIYLFFSEFTGTNCSFNYSDTSVAILSALIAILLGWNIWSVIDSKGFEKKVQREFNYAHNKMDYDLGLIYGYFSQMLAMNISNLEKQTLKVHMLEYMINSLKILSKMPNTSIEINSIAETIASAMGATKSITIDTIKAQSILERLGEIENREEIKGIDGIRKELLLFINANASK